MTLQELIAQRKKLLAEARAIPDLCKTEERSMTDDEKTGVDEKLEAIKGLDADIERAKTLEDAEARQTAIDSEVVDQRLETGGAPTGVEDRADTTQVTMPASAMRFGSTRVFDSNEDAYRFGLGCAAAIGQSVPQYRNDALAERARDMGVAMTRTANEGTNTEGGFLVQPEYSPTIIRLVEQYGTFRPNARREPMGSDTKNIMRRTSGLTASHVGEGSAPTATTIGWDRIQLTARTVKAWTKMTREFNDDAMISFGDQIAIEMAQAYANREDTDGWVGTGAAANGGIVGVRQAILTANGDTSDNGGCLVTMTGNLATEQVLADFNKAIARVPAYALPGAAWYCSSWFHALVMQRLEAAAGGNTISDLKSGAAGMAFLGFPVKRVQVLPTADADTTVQCFFGDLAKAATFGDRASMSVEFGLDGNDFSEGLISAIGFERYDIKVHDVGTSTEAGPIVALQSVS